MSVSNKSQTDRFDFCATRTIFFFTSTIQPFPTQNHCAYVSVENKNLTKFPVIMKLPIQVTKFTYSGSSEEESAAIRMRFPTKIPVSKSHKKFFSRFFFLFLASLLIVSCLNDEFICGYLKMNSRQIRRKKLMKRKKCEKKMK